MLKTQQQQQQKIHAYLICVKTLSIKSVVSSVIGATMLCTMLRSPTLKLIDDRQKKKQKKKKRQPAKSMTVTFIVNACVCMHVYRSIEHLYGFILRDLF